jgi:hypothetical protein
LNSIKIKKKSKTKFQVKIKNQNQNIKLIKHQIKTRSPSNLNSNSIQNFEKRKFKNKQINKNKNHHSNSIQKCEKSKLKNKHINKKKNLIQIQFQIPIPNSSTIKKNQKNQKKNQKKIKKKNQKNHILQIQFKILKKNSNFKFYLLLRAHLALLRFFSPNSVNISHKHETEFQTPPNEKESPKKTKKS